MSDEATLDRDLGVPLQAALATQFGPYTVEERSCTAVARDVAS